MDLFLFVNVCLILKCIISFKVRNAVKNIKTCLKLPYGGGGFQNFRQCLKFWAFLKPFPKGTCKCYDTRTLGAADSLVLKSGSPIFLVCFCLFVCIFYPFPPSPPDYCLTTNFTTNFCSNPTFFQFCHTFD